MLTIFFIIFSMIFAEKEGCENHTSFRFRVELFAIFGKLRFEILIITNTIFFILNNVQLCICIHDTTSNTNRIARWFKIILRL